VLGIAQAVTADGTSQLQVRVRISNDAGSREEIVLFNLVNNIWLRAS